MLKNVLKDIIKTLLQILVLLNVPVAIKYMKKKGNALFVMKHVRLVKEHQNLIALPVSMDLI